jgi:hypothetical protein
MKIRRHHLLRSLFGTAVLVSLAAPAARAGQQDLGTPYATRADSRASANELTARVDRAVIARHRALGVLGEPKPTPLAGTFETFTQVREDGSYFDTSLGRRIRVTPRVTIVEPSAFDWGDAGVGAAGAFGLVLLAGGVVLLRTTTPQRRVMQP